MNKVLNRIAILVAVLATLWLFACLAKSWQIRRVVAITGSVLINYQEESALPRGRLIEVEWLWGYCWIVGYSCGDIQAFELLCNNGKMHRVRLTQFDQPERFARCLSNVRSDFVILDRVSITGEVFEALSKTQARQVSLEVCDVVHSDKGDRAFESMQVYDYAYIARTSEVDKRVTTPLSARYIALVCREMPENIGNVVERCELLETLEVRVPDFNNASLSWACKSRSLRSLHLRGKNINLDSARGCGNGLRVIASD